MSNATHPSSGEKLMMYPIRIWCVIALLVLQACASSTSSDTLATARDAEQVQVKPGNAPIPGGYWMYSYGPGQTADNFENVEVAQYDYALWRERSWKRMGPQRRVTANRIGLQVYYPLHVRWRLKDGREFVLENIDVPAIMREYFRTHSLQLQWQREGRPKTVGDNTPTLAHEVKDDSVIIKWVISINQTPVGERLTSTGAATKWDLQDEEYPVAILKGNPTHSIDFSK